MAIDRSLKTGVVASVIATFAFIYLLDPALRLISFLLFDVFRSISHAYTDRLFAQAALLVAPDSGFLLLSAAGMSFCGFSAGLGTSFLARRWIKRRPEDGITRSVGTRRLARWSAISVLILANIAAIGLVFSTMFQLRVTTSFSQHLTAIAPYVGEQDLKMLRSRWTQMNSEVDFRAIYEQLNTVARANALTLPENKVYSFSSF